MPPFRFPLARVLQIRRAQADHERGELERLTAARGRLAAGLASLEASALGQARSIAQGNSGTNELQSVDRFGVFVRQERQRVHQELALFDRDIAEQQARLREAEQRCRLLEKLETRQRAGWEQHAAKELEELAADAYRARRHRQSG